MAGHTAFTSWRRGSAGKWHIGLVAILVLSPHAWAAGPALLSAVSRMSHGGTNFDVQLPQTAPYSIECRGTGSTLLVMTFDQNVTAGTAAVTTGAATAAAPAFSGATMSVALTNMADAQQVTVTLSNIVGPGGATAAVPISFRTLIGDVDGNGSISTHDITTIKVNINKSVAAGTMDGSNFRCDMDLNGSIGTHDLTTAKLAIGNTVTGGGAFNTPPTITTVADQTAIAGQASSPVGFTIGDAQSAVTTLAISAVSSDQTLIPNANIALAGTGASKTFVITPPASVSGTCQVTLSVSDGLASTSATFNVVVKLPPTLYLATLKAMPGVNSLASGTATLSLAGDLKSAVLKYSYSNLAGADSDDAIYVPANQLVYDIPVAKLLNQQQQDGSYLWTFTTNPNANPNAATIVSAIQGNVSSIIIESAAYPNGELQGVFQLVQGSPTFSPPADPPTPFVFNPPSAADASRFMQQAAFGGTFAEISSLSNAGAANASTALNDWLTTQFASPLPISPAYSAVASPQANTFSPSSMYKQIFDRVCIAQAPNPYGDSLNDDRIHEAWWKNAVTGQDQLRQRVATALSEIYVVSEVDDNIDVSNHLPALATYYDMLADDAFGLFYDPISANPCLLRDVTLHPIMGDYLTMAGNYYVANQGPNENYAREVLQLFSVGLYMLQPDGSLMLDQAGAPIPTYDQPAITNFAHVFTGWNTSGTSVVWQTLISDGNTPPAGVTAASSTNWVLPMQVTQNKHSPLAKQLLVYPNAAKWPGQSTPGLIPANSGATAGTELEFALANIFNHPNVGPFICKQLIQRLVGSNPSPAYVYRVAKKFGDNGSGVRGDMKAVITAILTDYEARNTASNANVINNPGYGHMREPMLRVAGILRSLGAVSKSNKWLIGKGDATYSQTIFRSPTVFNFFNPTFIQPGPIQAAGLVSPEFDVIYETTITNTQNLIYNGIYATYITSPAGPTYGAPAANAGLGFRGDSAGTDVYLDFSTGTGNSLTSYAQTNGIPALIDRVGLLLMGAPMDPSMKTQIQNFVGNTANISATDYLSQCKAVVHLIATSPACATQK